MSDQKKNLFKIWSGTKFNLYYQALLVKFNDASSKGHHVSYNCLWIKGSKTHKEQEGDKKADLKKHVIVNFIKRHNLNQRKIQRSKSVLKEHYRSEMKK